MISLLVELLVKISTIGLVVCVICGFLSKVLHKEIVKDIFALIAILGIATYVGCLIPAWIHCCMTKAETKKITAGLTKIERYYDYINDEEYKLITTEEINKTCEDSFVREIYADDFGKVFIVTDKSEKLFEPIITKTEIKSSDADRKIVPKYPDGYQGIARCKCISNGCTCKEPSEEMSKSDIDTKTNTKEK